MIVRRRCIERNADRAAVDLVHLGNSIGEFFGPARTHPFWQELSSPRRPLRAIEHPFICRTH